MSRRFLAAALGALIVCLAAAPGAVARKPAPAGCNPLDTRDCLLPYPSNVFTVREQRADSGRRLALPAFALPGNVKHKRMNTADYARNDGFSPGTAMLTYVPGLDLKRTGATPITDLRSSLDRSQPIAVIDAVTRKRQMVWAELDTADKAQDRILMIHPAKNLEEGHRYIVALRRLRNSAGALIAPGAAFRSLRDGSASRSRVLNAMRPHYHALFRTLAKAGIKRDDLFLAWDFTVASKRNLSERARTIRDESFLALGDDNLQDAKVKGRAPAYRIDSVQEFAPCASDGCQSGQNDLLARKVVGTLIAPCYLNRRGCPPGSKFDFRRSKSNVYQWLPKRIKGNTMDASFTCIVPRVALLSPARLALYGHGLFGSQDEVMATNVQQMAQEHDFVFCATREIGMSNQDVPNALGVLRDLSKFPSIADRLQQGLLNGLLLGRLMVHPQGLVTQPAFRATGGGPAVDTHSLFYDSNSQGAIFGGALTALAPDFQRAVLGVPGMNYSLLLPRSADFDAFLPTFGPAYRSHFKRTLALTIIQSLWDRGEADGYAAHMGGDALDNSPTHSVLLDAALGDHQVAQISAENEARTIGAQVRAPGYDPGRSADKIPFYGLTEAGSPALGSVLVIWDSGPIRAGGALGTDVAPLGDVPPRAGSDPHELVRSTPEARRQKSAFLTGSLVVGLGTFIDVCPKDRACRTSTFPY